MNQKQKRKIIQNEIKKLKEISTNRSISASVVLPEEYKIAIDHFIFELNEDKSPLEKNVGELGRLMKKENFSYLSELVSYMNGVSEIGGEDNERVTRFGHLFQNDQLCESWFSLMKRSATLNYQQTNKSMNYMHLLFKHCELNVDGARLIDIVSHHDHTPFNYYLHQNAMILRSIEPEMVSKIRAWVLSETNQKSLSQNCLESVKCYWEEKIHAMPMAPNFIEARAKLCEKAIKYVELIKDSTGHENKNQMLEGLAFEMMETRYSPELMPHFNIYTKTYLNSWLFHLQDLPLEPMLNFALYAGKHKDFDNEIRSFLINATSKSIWDDKGDYLSYDNMASIAVTYPALKKASAIIEANMALKEKELLSHELFHVVLSAPRSSKNKI